MNCTVWFQSIIQMSEISQCKHHQLLCAFSTTKIVYVSLNIFPWSFPSPRSSFVLPPEKRWLKAVSKHKWVGISSTSQDKTRQRIFGFFLNLFPTLSGTSYRCDNIHYLNLDEQNCLFIRFALHKINAIRLFSAQNLFLSICLLYHGTKVWWLALHSNKIHVGVFLSTKTEVIHLRRSSKRLISFFFFWSLKWVRKATQGAVTA